MVPALSGVVTKATLFVRPQYAQERELLALTKFKLHEAGFIVIHEEYRRLNDEMADTIAVQLDRTALMSGVAAPLTCTEDTAGVHRVFTRTHATSVGSGQQQLVGHVYLYVLAYRNCHAELLNFLDRLFADDDYVSFLMSPKMRTANGGDDGTTGQSPRMSCPLFCNATAIGAKQAVQLLFPRMLVHDVPTAAASREYVQAELKDALLSALVELSKAKPENPIQWLAERLLHTNTRAPPLISKLGEGASS